VPGTVCQQVVEADTTSLPTGHGHLEPAASQLIKTQVTSNVTCNEAQVVTLT